MPVPRGKKDNPTNDSIVELLPADWLPNTTIWGRESSASVAPSVAASCWSRASVSTTAPSTTRVGGSCAVMVVIAVVYCCGFVCRGYDPAVGVGAAPPHQRGGRRVGGELLQLSVKAEVGAARAAPEQEEGFGHMAVK